MYAIKIREKGKRRWDFLTSDGRLTHLRLHAAMTDDSEKAQGYVQKITEDNPGFEAKVVSMFKAN